MRTPRFRIRDRAFRRASRAPDASRHTTSRWPESSAIPSSSSE
jgi:hypothetical protein